MKFKGGKILVALMILWVGCGKEPDYSVVPEIALTNNGLKFIDSPESGDADTLRISLRFTDGDGDLGLDEGADIDGEYAQKFYKIYYAEYSTGQLYSSPYSLNRWTQQRGGYSANTAVTFQKRFWISTADANVRMPGTSPLWREFFVLNYKAKRTVAALQSFPEFVKPYNCTKWDVETYKVDNVDVKDTLSVEFNPYYYNIFIEFYTKNPDGTFSFFDPGTYFTYPSCNTDLFSGRFPILAADSKNPVPLNGIINYSIPSIAFIFFFGNKALKLKIYILDRSRHKSNVVETPEFTLQSIKGR